MDKDEKWEIEDRGGRILISLNKLSKLVSKKQTDEDKIEIRRELDYCVDEFRLLIFDITT